MKKLLRKIKKSYRKFKYLDKTKARYFTVITIISAFTLFIGGTYSYFAIHEHFNSNIITIANLKYQLTSTNKNFKNNSITVGAGKTITLDLDLKSLNEFNTKYALDYTSSNPDVKVYYVEKKEQNVEGEIAGLNSIITIKIAIKNTTSEDQTIDFNLKGGYLQNELSSNITEALLNSPEVTLAKLGFTPSEDGPNLTTIAPKATNYTQTVEKKENMYPHVDNYFTYSDSYELDPVSGKFKLINPTVCKFSDCGDNLNGKYVASVAGSKSNSGENFDNLDIVYLIKKKDYISITYTYESYQTNEQDLNDRGIYSIEDDYGTSYYFRGNIKDNYVKFGYWQNEQNADIVYGYKSKDNTGDYTIFNSMDTCNNTYFYVDGTGYHYNCTLISSRIGKPMYWRILRVNGDGSVRLIYDGTEPHPNGEANTDRVAFQDQWELDVPDEIPGEYVVSSYYDSKVVFDSHIKESIDNWYLLNISSLDQYISDSIFCNDDSDVEIRLQNSLPNLKCSNKRNAYTVHDNDKGNGLLSQKVGLASADEIFLAGAHTKRYDNNKQFYLYKGLEYWTMTILDHTEYSTVLDGGAVMTTLQSDGKLNILDEWGTYEMSNANKYFSVVPVINLSPETVQQLVGNGTPENPFRLEQ